MPKAHVIFTGGTIGSMENVASIGLMDTPPDSVLEFAARSHPHWSFTSSEPFRILSENADPSHWEILARHIVALPLTSLDAVVVCHGSDTLPWTASALSFLLAGIPLPVVVLAANKPLNSLDSNGYRNISGALNFCEWEQLPGVFVAWGNPDELVQIHLGSRLQSADIYTDHFESVARIPFAVLEAERCVRTSHPINPSRTALSSLAQDLRWKISQRLLMTQQRIFSRKLLTLPSSPGLDYSGLLVENHHWDSVLVVPFHSGTTCVADLPTGILEFCTRAKKSQTEIILGPVRLGSPTYQSMLPLLALGVKLLPAMSIPTAEVLIRFLMGTQGNLAGLDANMQLERIDK